MPPFQELVDHAREKEAKIITSKQSDSKLKHNNMWILLFVLLERN